MTGWKGLSLFSGIGGIDLAFEWAGGQVVAMCEIQPYCQKILRKHWPNVPLFEDIKNLRGTDVGTVDVIYGGFPCQPCEEATAWQEGRKDKTIHDIYGRSFRGWSVKLDRVGLSLSSLRKCTWNSASRSRRCMQGLGASRLQRRDLGF